MSITRAELQSNTKIARDNHLSDILETFPNKVVELVVDASIRGQTKFTANITDCKSYFSSSDFDKIEKAVQTVLPDVMVVVNRSNWTITIDWS
jgi:hypothetical protein